MNQRMDGGMNESKNGWMEDGWTEGWTDHQRNECMTESKQMDKPTHK